VVPSFKNVAASQSNRIIAAWGTFYPDMDTYTRLSPTSHMNPLILYTIHSLLLLFWFTHSIYIPTYGPLACHYIIWSARYFQKSSPECSLSRSGRVATKDDGSRYYVTDGPSKVHQSISERLKCSWPGRSIWVACLISFAIWFDFFCFCRRNSSASRQGRLLLSLRTSWKMAQYGRQRA